MQRQTARILAVSAVALQAANAMQLEAQATGYYLDTDKPTEYCCRLYRNERFQIRPAGELPSDEFDFRDFCSDNETDEKVHDLSDASNAPYGLDNDIESYKCGANVAIKFCTQGEHNCDQWRYGESGAGSSESQNLGIHDSHTVILLTPYDPSVRHAATVYENDFCNGHQSVVWIDEGSSDSGDTYTNIH